MADFVLAVVALGAVLAYAGSLFLWPFAPCRWCQGRGTTRGSTRRRCGNCHFCGGSRRRRRLGSSAVHQLVTTTRNKGWRK